jgi:ABC-type multidrug transport system ATPase subunit/pSer/pThr/pTyr-binding forkhead associated (FHA) protein
MTATSSNPLTIGRASGNDLVVHHAHVSKRHARLEVHPQGLLLRDLGSTNGTYLNSLDNPIETAWIQDEDLIYFSRCYHVTGAALRRRLTGGEIGSDEGAQQIESASDLIRIGRDPDNDIIINRLNVGRHHAEIRKLPDGRRELRDLGTRAGTFVNDRLIRGESVVIGREDRIEIGGLAVSLSFSEAPSAAAVPANVGVEREGMFIRAEGLAFRVGSRKLLDGVDLALYPGELVGLMGPSGCGKTTLMNLLIGRTRPEAGSVEYNGVDLHANLARFGPQIGFVPQDDILHPELTVREVLYYNARLKLPLDVSDREINEKIDRLCEQLGLYKPGSSQDVRDVLVGSPERKGLSGGQKKRVSLAIELLTDPKVLFLDEPTSGLSSKDTRTVMELLQSLVHERGITVVITIHQPSPRVYSMLDKVIYLKQGRLCYFGPAFPDSIQYFDQSEDPSSGGPDIVMERLEDLPEQDGARKFVGSSYYDSYVRSRWVRMAGSSKGAVAGSSAPRSPAWMQFVKLTERYGKCKLRDVGFLAILLSQAPLVAVLLCVVFLEEEMRSKGTVLFLLGFVALWFGVNNSAREIVGEFNILKREQRSGLSIEAYLGSKLCVQGLITFLQCFLLVAVVGLVLGWMELPIMGALLISWIGSLVGVAMGLTISAWVRSQISAIVAVPLVLIPVILLGGMVNPHKELVPLAQWISDFTPARWVFSALIDLADARLFAGYFEVCPTVWVSLGVLCVMLVGFVGAAWAGLRRQ